MNRKKEYNRCYIPEIVMKKSQKEEIKDPMIEAEHSAIEIIKMPIWKKRVRNGPEKFDAPQNAKN